jgi:hypothetical protein
MMRDKRNIFLQILVLCFVLVFISEIMVVKANEAVYIRADGNIEGTDKILREGNVYTLIDNIVNQSVMVGGSNIVIDGAGYTIQGPGIQGIGRSGMEIANPNGVTVTNVTVQGFDYGIAVFGYEGNRIDGMIIAGNNLTDNYIGIRFSSYSNYVNNTVIGNHIRSNHYGIHIAEIKSLETK